MELNIRAGMRVLYKHNNSNWLIGRLRPGAAVMTDNGLYLYVWTNDTVAEGDKDEDEYVASVNINDIFFDAVKLDDWIKDYPQYFMTKEDYIKLTQEEDFDRQRENAYVSDGEYMYYPVSKFSKSWIEKQPFDYVVRGD